MKKKCARGFAGMRGILLPTALFLLLGTQPSLASLAREFVVNTTRTNAQFEAASAKVSDTEAVVVWTDFSNDVAHAIRGQLIGFEAQKVGAELDLVRMGRDEGPFTPSVAMFSNDDFVVSWTQHAAGGDTNVYARIFDFTGTPLTGIITVGGGTFKEHDPDVAVDPFGFVVAYTRDTNGNNPDVFAKRYDFSGRLLNVINVGITPKAESHPSIAHGAGDLVVAYQLQFSGSDDDILLSRFTLGGSALGTITVVGSTAPEQWPSLAIESDNNAVVAYQKFSSGDWDIKARRVSFPGPVGKEINVRNTSAHETNPSVALKAAPAGPGGGAGSFVVAYNSFNQVKATEISPFDAVLAHHDAGLAGSFSPAVSISSLSGEYLMTYTFEPGFPFSDRNILGRFGRLCQPSC